MESLSRFVIAVPMKDMTTNTVMAKFVKHVICTKGIFERFWTDLGTNFQSEAMEDLCEELGIKQNRSTSWHAQSQGAVQRVNRSLVDMLTAFTYKD